MSSVDRCGAVARAAPHPAPGSRRGSRPSQPPPAAGSSRESLDSPWVRNPASRPPLRRPPAEPLGSSPTGPAQRVREADLAFYRWWAGLPSARVGWHVLALRLSTGAFPVNKGVTPKHQPKERDSQVVFQPVENRPTLQRGLDLGPVHQLAQYLDDRRGILQIQLGPDGCRPGAMADQAARASRYVARKPAPTSRRKPICRAGQRLDWRSASSQDRSPTRKVHAQGAVPGAARRADPSFMLGLIHTRIIRDATAPIHGAEPQDQPQS